MYRLRQDQDHRLPSKLPCLISGCCSSARSASTAISAGCPSAAASSWKGRGGGREGGGGKGKAGVNIEEQRGRKRSKCLFKRFLVNQHLVAAKPCIRVQLDTMDRAQTTLQQPSPFCVGLHPALICSLSHSLAIGCQQMENIDICLQIELELFACAIHKLYPQTSPPNDPLLHLDTAG